MLVLRYEEDKLTVVKNDIDSADSLVTLYISLNCTVFGVLTLNNNSKKIIQFIKPNDESEYLIARLVIDEDSLPLLSKSTIHLELINGELSYTSNKIELLFNIPKIKTDVKIKLSNELAELTKKIAKLDEKVNAISSDKIIKNLNLVNPQDIRPGMVPVALTNGLFAAMYPFADHVISVNGQVAADGAVIIDSSMIKYNDSKTVKKALEDQTNAIIALRNLVQTIDANQRTLMSRLDELDIRLTQHINNGIV